MPAPISDRLVIALAQLPAIVGDIARATCFRYVHSG
jgi:hypothetical protein